MKNLVILLLCILPSIISMGQGNALAEAKFHQGSNLFINGNPDAALAAVNEGLRVDPKNIKLTELKKLLEQEKKKQEQQKKEQQEREQQEKQKQQQKEQQEKEQKDKQQKQEQDKQSDKDKQKEKDSKDEQDKKEQEKDVKQNEEQEKKDKENKEVPPEVMEKLKQMKISEEKARMILEAMKNQEIQYLQQNKRQSTKPKDRNKPDW